MRSAFLRGLFGAGLAVLLGGCAHIELLHSRNASTMLSGDSGSTQVDVRGIGDSVSSQSIVVKRIPFPVDEYRRLKTMGNSTVKGTISITADGRHIVGRQTRLYLNPVTSYSDQWYRESYLGGHKMGKSDPRLFNYLKFTASNEKGAFAFYGVPAGDYYVVGTVACSACGGKNIRIARKIHVENDQSVTVNLNKTL